MGGITELGFKISLLIYEIAKANKVKLNRDKIKVLLLGLEKSSSPDIDWGYLV